MVACKIERSLDICWYHFGLAKKEFIIVSFALCLISFKIQYIFSSFLFNEVYHNI